MASIRHAFRLAGKSQTNPIKLLSQLSPQSACLKKAVISSSQTLNSTSRMLSSLVLATTSSRTAFGDGSNQAFTSIATLSSLTSKCVAIVAADSGAQTLTEGADDEDEVSSPQGKKRRWIEP